MRTRFRLAPEPVYGLIDPDGRVDLTMVALEAYMEVTPEGDDFPLEFDPQRGDSTAKGCSTFSGPAAFDTYEDAGGDHQVHAMVTWTQTYQYKGGGVGADLAEHFLFHILRTNWGDGGEAVPGQAEGTDTLNFIDEQSATATTPGRWRIGDNAIAEHNGKVYPLHVSNIDGATLTFNTGLGLNPGAGVVAYIGRTLFEGASDAERGPSTVWLIDGPRGHFAWAVVGVRSQVTKITREERSGRMLFEVQHMGTIRPRHAEADPKCNGHKGCGKGAVAYLKNTRPFFTADYCGDGGALGDPPHSSPRMAPLDLKAFEVGIEIEQSPFEAWTREESPVIEIDSADSGEGTITMTFAKPMGRVEQFDLDAGRDARRSLSYPSKPVGPGSGVMLWLGSVGVDSYTHAASFEGSRGMQEVIFKLDSYCGDVDDPAASPAANRSLALVFIR